MTGRRCAQRGISLVEAALFWAILLTALLCAQRMVKAHLAGRYKAVADSFGHGRQYEPKKTIVSP